MFYALCVYRRRASVSKLLPLTEDREFLQTEGEEYPTVCLSIFLNFLPQIAIQWKSYAKKPRRNRLITSADSGSAERLIAFYCRCAKYRWSQEWDLSVDVREARWNMGLKVATIRFFFYLAADIVCRKCQKCRILNNLNLATTLVLPISIIHLSLQQPH